MKICCNFRSLSGKAQRDWDLLEPTSKHSYKSAVKALGEKLNFDSKAMAAQDFHHMSQCRRDCGRIH